MTVTITITDIGNEKVDVKVKPSQRDIVKRGGTPAQFAAAWMAYSLTRLKKPITERPVQGAPR